MKWCGRFFIWGILALVMLSAGPTGAEETARLTIQSEPSGATVFLDGQEMGVRTPVRLNVSAGTHQVRLVKPGYREVSRQVEVSGAGMANFSLVPLEGLPVPMKPASPMTSAPIPTPTPIPVPAPLPAKTPETNQSPAPTVSAPSSDSLEKRPFGQTPTAPARPAPFGVQRNPPTQPLPAAKIEPKKIEATPIKNNPALEKPAAPTAAVKETAPASGDSADPGPAENSGDSAEVTPCLAGDSASGGEAKCLQVREEAWPDSAEILMVRAAANLPKFPEKFNVLLLGLDRRDRKGMLATGAEIPEDRLGRISARSDVIVVIQLDFAKKQMRMVSIPRDTKVRIRGGYNKINAAYASGRERLAKRVVEDFFQIQIHRVVTVDWRGAKKGIALFKSLGLDYNGFSEKEIFWHLRKRSFTRGDFHRIERQQLFLRYGLGEYLRLYNETRQSQGAGGVVKKGLLEMAVKEGLSWVDSDLTFEELEYLSYVFRDYDVRKTTLAQVHGAGELEGDSSGESQVYIFNPSSHHTFNEIVARVEKQ